MSPEEIQSMAKGLAQGQAGWYVLSAIIGGVFTGVGAYWAEKSKNRATKQDIDGITRKVEKVRDEFNRGLEDLKAHHQLRMVAAERRLQAHQEAYTHWQNLVSVTVQPDKTLAIQTANDAHAWYVTNCIYLTEASRQAFLITWKCSHMHFMPVPPGESDRFIQNYEVLNAQGNVFLSEVELPELRAIDKIPDAAPTPA